MEKSPEAFRTISEVADLLETPAHVLRFWESRFPQIRPVKRAGGRRYYRPGDVALLAGIKKLLHDDGLTIRGVQKILREQGIRHVAGMAAPLPDPLPGGGSFADAEMPDDDAAFLLSALSPPAMPSESAQIIPLVPPHARQEGPVAPAQDEGGANLAPEEGASTLSDAPEAPFIEADETNDTEEREAAESLPLFGLVPAPRADDPTLEDVAQIRSDGALAETAPQPPATEAETGPADPAPDAEEAAPDADMDEVTLQHTVAALLRRSRKGRLAPRKNDLVRLHDRLADLRDRVAEASRRRAR